MERMALVHAAPEGLSAVFLNVGVTTDQVKRLVARMSHLNFRTSSVCWWFADGPEDTRELRQSVVSALGMPVFNIYTIVEMWSDEVTSEIDDVMTELQSIPGLPWKGYSPIVQQWGSTFAAVRYGERPRFPR